jgi:hypothetical protein
MDNAAPHKPDFGSCCDDMKAVLEADDFDPLIAVGDNGILYMSVGMLEAEDGEADVVDHPLLFCPFCGKQVQTIDEIEAKAGTQDDD